MTGDRASAIQWAARIVADTGVVYLDTETTGLDDGAEIVDIAALDNRGSILLNTLVRPAGPVPAETTAIHGITDAMVSDAPGWTEVYQSFARLLHTYPTVVTYNAEFDFRIVRQVSRRYGLPMPPASWECAMLQYASYAGVWHPKHQGWRWHRLTAAAAAIGHASPAIHRAASDAAMCRAVVRAMAEAVPIVT